MVVYEKLDEGAPPFPHYNLFCSWTSVFDADGEMRVDQIAEYRDAFSLFDKDSNGLISTTELGAVMHSLGLPSEPAEIHAMIEKLDANQNGAIDFPEFLEMMAEMRDGPGEGEREMVEAFVEFDKDGNGFISREELQGVLAKFGERHSDAEVEAMIAEIDVDGDGLVNYSEFVKMMKMSK